MVATSAKDIRRFTPAFYEGRDNAPVYFLAALTWRERGRFRGALVSDGLHYPQHDELARAAAAAVEELAPDNQDELLGVIESFRGFLATTPPLPDDAASDDEKAAFAEDQARRVEVGGKYDKVMDLLRQHPRIAFLLGQRVLFNENVGPLAAQYTLRGWENVPHRFVRKDGVVPAEALDLLPGDDLRAIGNESVLMMHVSETQRGN